MSGNICFICNSYHDTTACPQASYSPPPREWQRCPICNGTGEAFAGEYGMPSVCPTCEGKRIIERPR